MQQARLARLLRGDAGPAARARGPQRGRLKAGDLLAAPTVPLGRHRPMHAAQAARAPRLARPRTFPTACVFSHKPTLTLFWRRRSFDVLPDGLGGPRSAFPHTLLLAAGTQAATAGGNSVTLLKLSNLTQGRHGSRVRRLPPCPHRACCSARVR